jgi:hypothetical protein
MEVIFLNKKNTFYLCFWQYWGSNSEFMHLLGRSFTAWATAPAEKSPFKINLKA